MVQKKLLVTLCILILIVSYAFKTNEPQNAQEKKSNVAGNQQHNVQLVNDSNYILTTETYSNMKIKIEYPQLKNLGDDNKQDQINQIIKEEAYGYLSNFSKDELDAWELDIRYHVTLESRNILSIQYSGFNYFDSAAYPMNDFYTTNIDLNKGEGINFADVFTLNGNFIYQIKKGKLVSEMEEASFILDDFSENEWLEHFQKIDSSESTIYFYFTEDSVGYSLEVNHAVGDHAEFELKYADIISNVNKNSVLWNTLMNM